jgi:hypothetical protein
MFIEFSQIVTARTPGRMSVPLSPPETRKNDKTGRSPAFSLA